MSVDIERRDSFAHLSPSETYIKAWYKLKELEVALCSTSLTTHQVGNISFLWAKTEGVRTVSLF